MTYSRVKKTSGGLMPGQLNCLEGNYEQELLINLEEVAKK